MSPKYIILLLFLDEFFSSTHILFLTLNCVFRLSRPFNFVIPCPWHDFSANLHNQRGSIPYGPTKIPIALEVTQVPMRTVSHTYMDLANMYLQLTDLPIRCLVSSYKQTSLKGPAFFVKAYAFIHSTRIYS